MDPYICRTRYTIPRQCGSPQTSTIPLIQESGTTTGRRSDDCQEEEEVEEVEEVEE